jgi:hypothetical protein
MPKREALREIAKSCRASGISHFGLQILVGIEFPMIDR